MKTVTITPTAMKSLRDIPKHDRTTIIAKLEAYAIGQRQDVVRLKGLTSLRLRHGDWRVIFDETATTIDVLMISHRREAYR
jgi:mRNA interferase RelE/StbE